MLMSSVLTEKYHARNREVEKMNIQRKRDVMEFYFGDILSMIDQW